MFYSLSPEEKRIRLVGLLPYLKAKLRGQDEALATVARIYTEGLCHAEDPPRPLGSVLDLGPTGTGKTETIKRIHEYLNGEIAPDGTLIKPGARGSDDAFELIACGFKGHEDAVQDLLGTPGESEGALYDVWCRLRQRGKGATLVLDEIDKAHRYIKDMMLNLLEEGTVTTANGTLMSFTDFFIVATSNFGAGGVAETTTRNEALLRDNMLAAAKDEVKGLRPEGVQRFGAIAYYKALSKETLNAIVRDGAREYGEKLRRRMIPSVYPDMNCAGCEFRDDFVARIRERLQSDSAGARFAVRLCKEAIVSLALDYIHENHSLLKRAPFRLVFDAREGDPFISHESAA